MSLGVYVKLFGSILDSSIWATDLPTRVVWITMLAMADENGLVSASVSGLARRACVGEPACRKALRILADPDPDSRTEERDGRRIEKVDGGWLLINYRKYRELRSKKQVMDAIRQTRHRVTKRDSTVTARDEGHITVEAEAEAEAEAKNITTTARARVLSAIGDSPDLDAVCKIAGNPEALCSEIMALFDGMRGTPPTVEAVRLALRDMAVTGNRPSGKMLRAFVRSATEGGGEKPGYTGYQEYK